MYIYVSVMSNRPDACIMTCDSGAGVHIVRDKLLLSEITQDSNLPVIFAANNSEMKVTAIGNISKNITTNVHVCPESTENLLSGPELQRTQWSLDCITAN
jgi:hypothetical protein